MYIINPFVRMLEYVVWRDISLLVSTYKIAILNKNKMLPKIISMAATILYYHYHVQISSIIRC